MLPSLSLMARIEEEVPGISLLIFCRMSPFLLSNSLPSMSFLASLSLSVSCVISSLASSLIQSRSDLRRSGFSCRSVGGACVSGEIGQP